VLAVSFRCAPRLLVSPAFGPPCSGVLSSLRERTPVVLLRHVIVLLSLAVLASTGAACAATGDRAGGERTGDARTGDARTGDARASNQTAAAAPERADGAWFPDARDDFDQPLPRDASYAERVVSLSPAFTEIAFAIGAGDRLVARTSWDDRPAAARALPDVGAGIRPNVEAVLAVRPTLVLLYASPENRAAADAFARAGVRTLTLRSVTLADVRRTTRILGVALGASASAEALVDSIDATLNAVREAVAGAERPRVVWPSWDAPVMVVGQGSFEAELLEIAGAENVFRDRPEPVATVTVEEIARRNPDWLLTGPDRVVRLRESATWRAVDAVRAGRLITLDTSVIGRPGVAVGMAAVSLARALHPDRADRLP
jgi:ABC-type Fe3+-hydroxamate transport system substrate-binding protein